ncbi:MAG TPA: hypothetical protein DER09_14585 [Prolixibacteraceae bacterium]|nr:hypothetical protein [Prolixibacteraceae bacterium]
MKYSQLSAMVTLIAVFVVPVSGLAQLHKIQTDKLEFRRHEINWGLNYSGANERESWKTDDAKYYEEISTNSVNLFLENRYWNFSENRQQQFFVSAKAGPLWGNGNWNDSSYIEEIDAEHRLTGLRAAISADYSLRYYYNNRNYTLLQVNAAAQYDWYNQTSEGTIADSNLVVSDYMNDSKGDRLRTEINARAGWGLGRLTAVNHFMTAEYLLTKYYSEQDFSQDEIMLLAEEIARLKNSRDPRISHQPEIEIKQLEDFLNQKMIQIPKRIMVADWESGEFSPRYNGSRVEFGPFFQYYNREPDFVYGGYLMLENARYCNMKWNRNFSAAINYNAYKHNDWVLGEIRLGWSYFQQLQSQWDLGLKYIPGLEIGDEKAFFYQGVVPYFSWFTQLNSKNRIDMSLAWRITSDEKLMLPGPEISVSVYRSKY